MYYNDLTFFFKRIVHKFSEVHKAMKNLQTLTAKGHTLAICVCVQDALGKEGAIGCKRMIKRTDVLL
jgi:hypothetical protein